MEELTEKQKAFDAEMSKLSAGIRHRWCSASRCACNGCVNRMGGVKDREAWEDWVSRHPRPMPLPQSSSIYNFLNKKSDLPK